ncbi:MAG: hypothetical protein ACE5FO_09265 [Parvularculaceae bacterium]
MKAMPEDRKQSPHYIPELDPERNNSDEGASDIVRMYSLQFFVGGLIGILLGISFEKPIIIGVSVAVVILGIAFWTLASLKKTSCDERK